MTIRFIWRKVRVWRKPSFTYGSPSLTHHHVRVVPHSSVFHVGLALHAVLCMRYAPQVIEATAHPVIFWLTAAVFPAIGSFRALHELRAEVGVVC